MSVQPFGLDVRLVEVTRHQLRDWLTISPDAKIVVARDGTLAMVNARASVLLERDDLEGLPVQELIPHGARAWHAGVMDAFFRSPEPQGMGRVGMVLGLTGTGRKVPLDLALAPISLEGDVAGLVTLRDISRERAMTAALADSNERLRTIVTAIPDTIVWLDADGTVALMNHLTEGLSAAEILGQPWQNVVAFEDHGRTAASLDRARASAEVVCERIRGPRGRLWDLQIRRVPRDDEVRGFVVVARDITVRQQEETNVRPRASSPRWA